MLWHWSVDVKRFQKESPEAFRLWRLAHLINYGLDGAKLSRKELTAAWPKIKDQLDPHKAAYLEFLLWNKKPSSREFNEDFWTLS